MPLSDHFAPRTTAQPRPHALGWPPMAVAFSLATLCVLSVTPSAPAQERTRGMEDRVEIKYSSVVNRDEFTHAQTSVGDLLDELPQLNPADRAATLPMLSTALEPMAFLLEDALRGTGLALDRSIDLGLFFSPGAEEPAWADLVRTGRLHVLTNGRGEAQVFLRTTDTLDPQKAFDRDYGVLRHIINFLLASAPDHHLRLQVFAYINDPATQTLVVNTNPLAIAYAAPAGPKPGTRPLNLDALAAFFESGKQLEGASTDSEGRVWLIGADAKGVAPSIDGRRPSLSDLAVAYRAMQFGNGGELYMSLDASPDPAFLSVQLAGRLADTSIGAVTLAADMRFKTLMCGVDPFLNSPIAEAIRKHIKDFRTVGERRAAEMANHVKGASADESIRFWFYPDNVNLATSQSGDTVRVVTATFTAGAEKQVGLVGGKRAQHQPRRITDTIDAFNHDRPEYAALFPEVQELNTIARLLAVASWATTEPVAQKTAWDDLLGVTLPARSTPRYIPTAFVYVLYDPNNAWPSALTWPLPRRMVKRASPWSHATPGQFAHEQERLNTVGALFGSLLYEESKKAYTPPNGWDRFTEPRLVVGGGLDLDLVGRLRTAQKISPAEHRLIREGAQVPLREIVLEDGVHVQLTSVGGGGGGATLPPGIPHALPEPEPGRWGFADIGDSTHEVAIARNERYQRVGPAANWRREASQTVYLEANGKVRQRVRYVNGRAIRYNVEAAPEAGDGKRVLVATRAREDSSDGAADIAVIRARLATHAGPDDLWKSLPEDTTVVDVRKLEDGSTAVTSMNGSKADGLCVTVLRDDGTTEAMTGQEGLDELKRRVGVMLEHKSNEQSAFVGLTQDGENYQLQIGKRRLRVAAEELEAFTNGDFGSAPDLLEQLRDPATPRQIVVYRGVGTTRPTRYGGSVKDGEVDDPVRFAASLRQALPDHVVALDDDPDAALRRLGANVQVTGKDDVFLLHEAGQATLLSFGTSRNAAAAWEAAGIPHGFKWVDGLEAHNIIVLAAHNEQELFDRLNSIGPKLKGRLVLLATCGEPANADNISQLLKAYDAAGFAVFPDRIDLDAVEDVVREMAEQVKAREWAKDGPVSMEQLWDQSIDAQLKKLDEDPILSRDRLFRSQVESLKGMVRQVSLLDHDGGSRHYAA